MAAALWKTSTANAFNTTLNGAINNTDTSIILTTATGLQYPGVICIDRVDGLGAATATKREYVSFTGITSSTLTGCTRGIGGSTAQSHSSGATVEENFSISHWNDLVTFLQVEHTATGRHILTSPVIRAYDGWIDANETWTYASASTITVPAGAASKYQKGDRIKWTQTTVKYGVIIAVADTLLTILVNTNYTVANAAITLNYYSHQVNPIGYPHWFACAAPTYDVTTVDDGAGGQPATVYFKQSLNGSTLSFEGSVTGVYKVAANSYVRYTPPKAPINAQSYQCFGSVWLVTSSFAQIYAGTVATADNSSFIWLYCNAAIADNAQIFFGWTGSYQI